ncbi:MAG: hypothetical protein VX910_04520 [Candidatus Latescibacterota bacterium]|nr:hypothetical protein [Candidatus Latescibacterota bacterium]
MIKAIVWDMGGVLMSESPIPDVFLNSASGWSRRSIPFIDDTLENVEEAREMDMNCIHF